MEYSTLTPTPGHFHDKSICRLLHIPPGGDTVQLRTSDMARYPDKEAKLVFMSCPGNLQ